MMKKRRTYTDEFKREAVKLVTEQRYSLAEAARNLGVHANLLRSWKQKIAAEDEQYEAGLTEGERMELASLRAENKRLRMERDILKKRRPSSRTRSLEVRVHRTALRGVADYTLPPPACILPHRSAAVVACARCWKRHVAASMRGGSDPRASDRSVIGSW